MFARELLPADSIVSIYNGVRLKTATKAAQDRQRSDYRIRLNADLDIDMPNDCISTQVAH